MLVAAFGWLFEANLVTRLIGLGISLITFILMRISLETKTFKALASEPDADADVANLGLASTLLLYWIRWRGDAEKGTSSATDPYDPDSADASECSPNAEPEIIIVIQCESFADPVELFGNGVSNCQTSKLQRRMRSFGGTCWLAGSELTPCEPNMGFYSGAKKMT